MNGGSPWMNGADAAVYLSGTSGQRRSKRFVLAEIKANRLRAARIGGRGEVLTRREWLDQWVEDQAAPVLMNVKRRA